MKAKKNDAKREAAAWREIARRIDAQPEGSSAFLCWHLDPVYREPLIDAPVALRRKMVARVHRHLEFDSLHGASIEGTLSWTEEKRQRRVIAALLLALEAEDDGSLLRDGGL